MKYNIVETTHALQFAAGPASLFSNCEIYNKSFKPFFVAKEKDWAGIELLLVPNKLRFLQILQVKKGFLFLIKQNLS